MTIRWKDAIIRLIANGATLFIEESHRGKSVEPYESIKKLDLTYPIYPDHDDEYLKECLENLGDKGGDIE
ncbi:MAG: hypothetical protein E7C89_05840 [Anaerococcus sp.]|uniref:hypothetical protein n=1 Tax=Anaerococcus sp. TaxID=1872515 RepID=UPI002903DA92|nr:hypothetical protein [Anaerococcus sp.]MDU2566102.1 hypothetical protein [Anaerococcus sp.]